MDLWKELNDFSMFEKTSPCPLCGEKALQTVVGNHFKCEKQGHVFNADGSDIGVKCTCETCSPRPPKGEGPLKNLIKKAKKKITKLKSRKKR